ncbi:MAG: hypothetical protein WCQ41_05780 [Bacillota bacterium]
MYLTIQDLTSILLCISVTVTLILLIICLFYLMSSLKRFDSILKKNEGDISEILNQLPQTIKKIDSTVEGIGEIVEVVKPAMINISGAVEGTAEAVNNINVNVLGKIADFKWALNIVSNIYNFIASKFGKDKSSDSDNEQEAKSDADME